MAQVLHMETGFPGKVSSTSLASLHGKDQDLHYSVETPYGYRLDLDFLKYVDDIEKGNTIKRIPVHRRPRYSSLPRGYGYTGSWWTSTESLCSNASMDSQHSSYSYCGRSFYPQYGHALAGNFNARVEKTLLDARKKLEDQAGSGEDRLRASGLQSLGNSISGSTSSLVGNQSLSRQVSYNGSQQGAPGPFTPVGSGLSTPVSPTPGHLQHVREQMAVALKKLRLLEEQVKLVPVLQVKISVLQEEKRQLSVQLKSQKFLGHLGGPGKVKSRGELYIDIPEEGAGGKTEESSVRPDKKEVRSVAVGMSAKDGKCDVGVAVREEELGLPSPKEQLQSPAVHALSTKIVVLETQLKRALQELQAAHQSKELQGKEKEDKWTSTGDGNGLTEWRVGQVGSEQEKDRPSQRHQDVTIDKNTVEVVQVETEPEMVTSTSLGFDHKPQSLETEESSTCLRSSADKHLGTKETRMPLCSTHHSDEVMETTFPVHAGSVAMMTTSHSVRKISIVGTEVDRMGKQGTETSDSLTPDSVHLDQAAPCLLQRSDAPREQEDKAEIRSVTKEEEATDLAGSRKSSQSVGVSSRYESSSSEDSSTAENDSDNESTESEYHEASDGLLEGLASAAEPRASPPTAAGSPTGGGGRRVANSSTEQAGNPGKGLSKELLSACQVLQKYLESSEAHMDEATKCAYMAVLHSWLRLSCHKEADRERVSLHLAAFRALSPQLLEFIINMADANGNTALHYTVSHSNFPVVAELLRTGLCHVDQQNKAGYTSIMLTALAATRSENDMETIMHLLERGNVNAKASQAGQTALMLAVSHGRQDMVRALLASGADVNVQDDDGSTALMCACEHGHAEIVRLLLATTGCDVTLEDHDGGTALSIAQEAGQDGIAVMLQAHLDKLKSTSLGTLKQEKPREVTETAHDAAH